MFAIKGHHITEDTTMFLQVIIVHETDERVQVMFNEHERNAQTFTRDDATVALELLSPYCTDVINWELHELPDAFQQSEFFVLDRHRQRMLDAAQNVRFRVQ